MKTRVQHQNAQPRMFVGGRMGRRAQESAVFALCVLVLLAPAILNGRPFLFFDTQHYLLVGKAIMSHVSAVLNLEIGGSAVALPPEAFEAAGADGPAGGGLTSIAGGRSPFYAVPVYLSSLLGGMWPLAIAQSTVVAWLIIAFIRAATISQLVLAPLPIVVALVIATPLGFHVNFMMPDIWAATLVLAISLVILRPAMSSRQIIALNSIMIYAMASHATTLALGIIAFGLMALSLCTSLGRLTLPRTAVISTGVAIVCAVSFSAVYNAAISRVTGERLYSPPYLMARVIADGPGEWHLATACRAAPAPYAVCAFSEMKFVNHDDFLWGNYAPYSFSTAAAPLKNAIQNEQMRFVVSAIMDYPIAQLRASLDNWRKQFFSLGITEIEHGYATMQANPVWRQSEILQAVNPHGGVVEEHYLWWEHVMILSGYLSIVMFYAMLVVMSLRRHLSTAPVSTRREHQIQRSASYRALWLVALYIGILVAANAAVSGILSGPNDRYQAKIIWLLPLFLICGAMNMRSLTGKGGLAITGR